MLRDKKGCRFATFFCSPFRDTGTENTWLIVSTERDATVVKPKHRRVGLGRLGKPIWRTQSVRYEILYNGQGSIRKWSTRDSRKSSRKAFITLSHHEILIRAVGRRDGNSTKLGSTPYIPYVVQNLSPPQASPVLNLSLRHEAFLSWTASTASNST